jgi:transposase
MPSVNKQSLREEIDTLKAQFERLCAGGKMASESRALFQAMLTLFELLMAVFMEKVTTKDSRNSSKPSSQTPGDDTAAGRPGAKGKGKPQNNGRCHNTRTVETVDLAQVHACETCGEDLSKTPCVGHERRTKIDIIFEKVVCHVDAEIKQCPRCEARTKGRFPADMAGPIQYGLGVKAYVLNLLIAQMVSLTGSMFIPRKRSRVSSSIQSGAARPSRPSA